MFLATVTRTLRIQPAMQDFQFPIAFDPPEFLFRFEQSCRRPGERLVPTSPALHVPRHSLDGEKASGVTQKRPMKVT